MSDERVISQAYVDSVSSNLNQLANEINQLSHYTNQVDHHVNVVDNKVETLDSKLNVFHDEFLTFVAKTIKDRRKQLAETRIVRYRQEIDEKYGHYNDVRRTATGILQATDIGIVRQSVISNISEELMIKTPGYWLAPCVVALSAWIGNNKEQAQRAIKEALNRDDEKASLFFLLVCRRANRLDACLKWTLRYLDNQDFRNLDQSTVIVLKAFANGLLGQDASGQVMKKLTGWLGKLSADSGYKNKQKQKWKQVFHNNVDDSKDYDYPYLKQYSETWSEVKNTLLAADSHTENLAYFKEIYDRETDTGKLIEELDAVLDSLARDYDDEELEGRKNLRLEELVIKYDGDEGRAAKEMKETETAYDEKMSFDDLLTTVAMTPENIGADVATQRLVIAMTKDWIITGYKEFMADIVKSVPQNILFEIAPLTKEEFQGSTPDGRNMDSSIKLASEAIANLINNMPIPEDSSRNKYLTAGGLGILGLGSVASSHGIIGVASLIGAGVMGYQGYQGKKQYEINIANYNAAKQELEELGKNINQIIEAIGAETVIYRRQFAELNANGQKVLDFLQHIEPMQFVKNRSLGRNVNFK